MMGEGFHIDQPGINFTSVLSEDELFNLINQGHLPKVPPVHASQVKYTVMHAPMLMPPPKIADLLCVTSLIFV